MKRRILLVDDEVAVLLTLKAVLEISGFDVDTAASGRDGKQKLRNREYHMIITDMRMENEEAGREVIAAARSASYHPAVALLTAFPLSDDDWQDMGADKMLVKPMHTKVLLQQIEKLLAAHEAKLKIWSAPAPKATGTNGSSEATRAAGEKASGKREKVKELTSGAKVKSGGRKVASEKPATRRSA